MNRKLIFIAWLALALPSLVAVAQEASARTVQYHSQDIVPIHAKLKYTTLIEVPPSEKIMEAATGDKDFWIVDVVGNFCFVHPAKAGISSNLNLITDKGNIYSFTLEDVSGTSAAPDLKVLIEPADRSSIVAASGPPQFVPAAQLEQSRQQLAALQSHVEQAVDEYKSAYPVQLKFDYTYKANEAPFDIQSIYHDDKFTYIKTNAPEKFSVYEMKDGKPNLITYDLRDGILGASSFEAVLHLANDPKSIVRCAPENQQQRVFAAMGLSAAAEIVLDLSAIATLFLCDAMNLLTKLNLPIIISQGCAEEIDRITGKTHDGSPRAGLRIGWQDEQMVGFEVTEQHHAERDQHFAKQLEKVRAIAVIEPCRELSAMAEETKKPLIAIFGRYGTQAILLAKKPGRVLWSDDFVQSSIAIKEYGVRVAWTELVVANLESKGLLSRKDAVAAVTTMLGYRYEVVTITPAIFVESARRASFDKSVSPFSHALVPFINLRITENIFAIIGGIASETIREVADNKERAIVIRSLLETIAARRDGIRVLGLISRAFQGAQLPWRDEWAPIINDVMTSAAIVFINKVNP
jgi:type IV secretory pathway VirB9-like protein